MSSVDERIVKMQFDNETFKKKAAETKQSLEDVNKAVDSTGKGKGMLDLNSNMKRVQVTASKMAVVTTAALGTIAAKATNVALGLASSLTFDPIRSGFAEYESLLSKQNVIMNATGKSATFVKKVLNDLNHYSDLTIFSFADMTEALTGFVNAGVPLPKASAAMKGIANASALAGASTQEAQSSFRAFSQALGQGFLGLQDFRQAAVTGKIGTVQFKQNLLDTAVAMGTLTKEGKHYVTSKGKEITATKGFDLSLQDQWATAQVLNKALGKYADTNTVLGRKAQLAATQVRSFSAFMDTLKESLGSGWSQIFTALFGGLEESTKLWTGLSNAVGGVVNDFFTFATTSLTTWRNLGGFEKTVQGLKNLMAPFSSLLKAIGTAWRSAFPNSGKGLGQGLYGISSGFEAITSPLQLLAKLITATTPVLKFFFQIIKIGATVIGNAVDYVMDFVGALLGLVEVKAPSGGGIVQFAKDIASAVADAVDKVSDLLSKGKSLTEAFGSVNIDLPSLPSLPSMPSMGSLFGGGDKQAEQVGKLTTATKGLTKSIFGVKVAADGVDKSALFANGGEKAKNAMSETGDAAKDFGQDVQTVGSWFGSVAVKIGGILKKLVDTFLNFAENFSFQTLIKSFNMALVATFTISIARMFNAFTKGFSGFAELGGTFNEVLGQVGDSISGFAKAQQRQATAKLILNIAIALGILAVSLWLLSKIPAEDLAKGLLALGMASFMLNRSVKALEGLMSSMNGYGLSASLNMMTMSVAIISLAAAMVLLALACLIMNKVNFTSIIKGVAVMWVAMKVLERLGEMGADAWKNMLAAAAALTALSFAMAVLAGALILFQFVKWESMGKAAAALAGITLAISALGTIPWPMVAAAGGSLLAASVGMIAIANALILFAFVKWSSIAKAAVILTAMALALAVMSAAAVGAPVILAVAGALVAFSFAGLMLNRVDWSSIGKMALILGVLIVALAALLAVLYLAAPVIPVLFLFALAMLALGVAFVAFSAGLALAVALAGVGVTAFAALAIGAAIAIAAFLQTLAAQAPIMKESFLSIIQAIVDTLVESVPIIIDGIKRMWAAIQKEFDGEDKKAGAKNSGKSWVKQIADGIEEKLPEIVKEATDIIVAFLKGLAKNAGRIATAGNQVIINFLNGLAKNIGGVIEAGANLIIAWIKGIGRETARIAKAASDAVIQFIHDMAQAIRDNSDDLGEAMADLGIAMVEGLIRGIGSMAGKAVDKVKDLTGSLINVGKGVLGIRSPSRVFASIGKFLVQGLTSGIQKYASSAIVSVASMLTGQIATANEYITKFIQDLDQKALAAEARANGLAQAAARAQKAANKTKSKKDDAAANALTKAAEAAQKDADKKEAAAEAAKARQDREEQFREASTIDKAKMRSEDAQKALDNAKQFEQRAATALAAANALDKQSRNKNYSAKERAAMAKQADALRAQAKADAAKANGQLDQARKYAAESLALQKKAGEEAAAAFQEQFEAEAKAAKDSEEFEKMTNEEKAKKRRADAAALEAQSKADLEEAKKLAFTDLEAANALAQKAMDEANQARDYLRDALSYEKGGVGGSVGNGSVVNLEPTEAASLAFNDYASMVNAAELAAGAGSHVEFNQYNSSPEPLDPTTVYRNTNSQLAFAADKLTPAA